MRNKINKLVLVLLMKVVLKLRASNLRENVDYQLQIKIEASLEVNVELTAPWNLHDFYQKTVAGFLLRINNSKRHICCKSLFIKENNMRNKINKLVLVLLMKVVLKLRASNLRENVDYQLQIKIEAFLEVNVELTAPWNLHDFYQKTVAGCLLRINNSNQHICCKSLFIKENNMKNKINKLVLVLLRKVVLKLRASNLRENVDYQLQVEIEASLEVNVELIFEIEKQAK